MDSLRNSLNAWFESLPPGKEFLPPPSPEAYAVLLFVFQYLPVIAGVQFLTPFYPQGKTSLSTRILNFPGRYAWCFMESIGAINLVYILFFSHINNSPNQSSFSSSNYASALSNAPFVALPLWNQVIATLYVLHYANRAVITPLFVAPSMSPIHAIIIFMATAFNYVNSSCLAGWLLGYGSTPAGFGEDTTASSSSSLVSETIAPCIPYIGIAIFLLGMLGNIRAEATLFRLRKEEAHRRHAITTSRGKSKSGTTASSRSSVDTTMDSNNNNNNNNNQSIYSKVYVIPPATGYFRFVMHPHYALEWVEWFGFLLIGFGVTSASSPSSSTVAPPIPLAPYYAPVANLLINKWGLDFPLPAVVFLVNSVSTTMARASWGRKWYADRFGEKAVDGRTAVVPYLI